MAGIVVGLFVLAGMDDCYAGESDLGALSVEFHALRAKKKALKPGEFDQELSGSGGRLSVVLAQLGDQLGKPGTPRTAILQYMGKPDAIKKAGEHQPGAPGAPGGVIPKGTTHLIYFWRGWHDYLYFVCRDGKVEGAFHYAALE